MFYWHFIRGDIIVEDIIAWKHKDNRSGLRIWLLNFLSITFKLGCCGSKICVADNFNHNKNITFKFAAAAATLVTDQVVEYLINPEQSIYIPESRQRW